MTQLNLLPDVKLDYLRTTRTKRLVIGISVLITVISIAVMLVLISIVFVFQKKNLSDLNKDITSYNNTLKSTPELDKVLTVQNQLNALTGLHDQKPVSSRLFDYLTQLTPATADISQVNADYDQNTVVITGKAASLDVANTFIDTLKFTTYKMVGSSDTSTPKAFSNVVLSQYSRNADGANYTISLSYDPAIFDSSNQIQLTVPNIISTRSATEQPTDLFQKGQ